MIIRLLGVFVLVVVSVCSCSGGGSSQFAGGLKPSEKHYWYSVPFKDLVVSADGRFVSVENNSWNYVYTSSLKKVGRFQSTQYRGITYNGLHSAFHPDATSGYEVYVLAPKDGSPLTWPEYAYLSCYNEKGNPIWETHLPSDIGTSIMDLTIGPDGTHYLGNVSCVAAFGPRGTLLWKHDRWQDDHSMLQGGAKQLKLGGNGILYAGKEGYVTAYGLDGTMLWHHHASEYFGGGYNIPAMLQSGNSPLLLVTNGAAAAIDQDGNLKWLYEDSVSTGRTYLSPLFGGNSNVYFIINDPPTGGSNTVKHWLAGLDTTSGQLVMEEELTSGKYPSLIAVDTDGSLITLSMSDKEFDTLSRYSSTGQLISTHTLKYPVFKSYLTGRELIVSSTGVVHYIGAVYSSPDVREYMLVSMDLDGKVLGTVKTTGGTWQEQVEIDLCSL